MSIVATAFGAGMIPVTRAPKFFQKPIHERALLEISPGWNSSIRLRTEATAQAIAATTSGRASPVLATHAPTINRIMAPPMLVIHVCAAWVPKSGSKTRSV